VVRSEFIRMGTQAMKRIVIATRKSRLALWQSEHCAELLRRACPGLEVELLPMSTRGDELLDRSLAEIGGKGLFLKELEKALLDGEADIAVHSLKDMPAEQPEGLALGAYLERADPRDLWISRGGQRIEELAPGSQVGSSSLRRISQLRALRRDLEIVPLRGNVETRLRAVAEGRVDATLLAAAGLERLGITPPQALALDPLDWLPAPGQGIIAIQQRAADASVGALLARVGSAASTVQAEAERAVVRALGGDCRMPLAVHAQRLADAELYVRACLGDGNGGLIRAERKGPSDLAERLGFDCADELLRSGAVEWINSLNLSQN